MTSLAKVTAEVRPMITEHVQWRGLSSMDLGMMLILAAFSVATLPLAADQQWQEHLRANEKTLLFNNCMA